jgi:hypothetical protein
LTLRDMACCQKSEGKNYLQVCCLNRLGSTLKPLQTAHCKGCCGLHILCGRRCNQLAARLCCLLQTHCATSSVPKRCYG